MSRVRSLAPKLVALALAGLLIAQTAPAFMEAEVQEAAVAPELSTCTTTLQSQIDAAPVGSTLTPLACIYRETVTVAKPLMLRAGAGTEIRGSDIWTDWRSAGPIWVSTASVPPFASETGSPSYVDAFHATRPEQVFVDGRALSEVLSSPTVGQFALDAERHVTLGADPTGHTVEVTVRDTWLLPTSNSVTVSGFAFKHAATAGQGWAIGNNNRAYFTLSNSTISDVHGSAVGLGGGDSYTSILDNTFTRIGDNAVTGYRDGHSAIRGNTIFGNGFGGWDWGWQAGGIKTAGSTNLLVDQNVVYGNGGPGVWCDIGCQNATISNNTVHDNTGPNVFFEVSVGASIFGNAVWHATSGWPAIYISSSANAEVLQNIVADPASNNRGANDRYWYPLAEDGETRFIWGSAGFSFLSLFAGTPAEQFGGYISTAQRDQVLSARGVPLAPEVTSR